MARALIMLPMLAVLSVVAADNADLVLPPLSNDTSLPEKLMVFVPGANVATEFYAEPALAIQQHSTEMRLWVVIPAMPQKRCIVICPSSSVCFELQRYVQAVVGQAVAQGYAGGTGGADVFVTGHSLGGICAQKLVAAYANSSDPTERYEHAVIMGAYVDGHDVANYPTPVLTLGAELDGGAARPGVTSLSLASSDGAAASHGGAGGAWQLTNKPVVILPGLDHSSFCPGFHVPGDVFPADVPNSSSTPLIAQHVAAFLHLHTPNVSSATTKAALALLSSSASYTRSLLAPLLAALALEGPAQDAAGPQAPWCAESQLALAQLDDAHSAAVAVRAVFADGSHNFEHTRTHYAHSGATLTLNASGYKAAFGSLDINDKCIVAAQEIGCKFVSKARIDEQLNTSAKRAIGGRLEGTATPVRAAPPPLTCADLNRRAYAAAISMLETTPAGLHTLGRFRTRGRPMCFLDDAPTTGNIGPLFVSSTLKVHDNGTCLSVQSVSLGPVPLDSWLFPGVHYCKLLSPARVVDYMMIDALKPTAGCLNA